VAAPAARAARAVAPLPGRRGHSSRNRLLHTAGYHRTPAKHFSSWRELFSALPGAADGTKNKARGGQ
jgi:hypothetical protein